MKKYFFVTLTVLATTLTMGFSQGSTAQTITFNSIAAKTIGATSFTLTATAQSALPVTFTITAGDSIATVSSNTVTLTNQYAGIVTIQATQAGNATFAAATPVNKSFTVNKKSNTISFTSVAAKKYGDPDFALVATSTHGLPVTFSLTAGSNIATLSTNTVSLTDTSFGNVTIKAEQAGNDTIKIASAVYKTFAVTKLPNAITFATIPNKVMGAGPFALSGSASSGLTITYSIISGGTLATLAFGNIITLTNLAEGTVQVKATQAGDDTTVAALSVTRSFTVSKQSNVISFTAIPNKILGAANFSVTATASSGLPVTLAITSGSNIATILGSTISLTDTAIGVVTVTASQAGNGTVKAATSINKTFTVSKQPNVISFPTISTKYVFGSAFTLGATASSGLPVTYTVTAGASLVTLSSNTVTITNIAPGTVTIKATQAGNDSVATAAAVSKTFTIQKATQSLVWTTVPSKTTADLPFAVTVTATSTLSPTITVYSGPATISGSTVTLTGSPGIVRLKAVQAGNALYAAAAQSFTQFNVSISVLINSSLRIASADDSGAETINLFPNPTSGLINVTSDEPIEKINVYDVAGKLVYSANEFNADVTQLNLSHLTKGTYMVVFSTTNSEKQRKIVLE